MRRLFGKQLSTSSLGSSGGEPSPSGGEKKQAISSPKTEKKSVAAAVDNKKQTTPPASSPLSITKDISQNPLLPNGNVPGTPRTASKYKERSWAPPSGKLLKVPVAEGDEIKMVQVKIGREEPINVPDTLAMYTTTWNMQGVGNIPDAEIANWIPKDFDLYAIAVQECKNIKTLHAQIMRFLSEFGEGGEFVDFKYKELGNSSLLIFAHSLFVNSGCLAPTRLNDMVKLEIKGKGLLSSSTGFGGILAQFTFHNCTIAFLMVYMDVNASFEKKLQDLDMLMKMSGVKDPDTNDIGTPALQKVHHVYMLGDFGNKAAPGLDATLRVEPQFQNLSVWSNKRWVNVKQAKEDEFEKYKQKIPHLNLFQENPSGFPPTTRRNKNLNGAILYPDMFDSLAFDYFNVLYDKKLIKAEGLPSYQDRVIWKSLDDFAHMVTTGSHGSMESMQRSSHVPVFATFLINGVDGDFLKRWQIITGNLPVETATRTDTNMVTGVVENLLQELAIMSSNSRLMEEALMKMKKCLRCAQPLSLGGGDVDLGEKGAFHRGCFTCEDCGLDLFNQQVREIEGRWLCYESFKKCYSCPACKLPMDGKAMIKVGGGIGMHYHLACFSCAECSNPLVQAGGIILPFQDLGGLAFCLDHFEEKKSKYCVSCRLPLENSLTKLGFHLSCMVCTACKQDLVNEPMEQIFLKDYKTFCDGCYLDALEEDEDVAAPPSNINPAEVEKPRPKSVRPKSVRSEKLKKQSRDEDLDSDDD